MDFTYACPTAIHFGVGIVDNLPDLLAQAKFGKRVLLVTDPGIVQAGIAGTIQQLLQDNGYSVTLFSQVKPNPRDVDCLAGTEVFKTAACDSIVAIGGGSAMDTAKAIGLLARHGGTPQAYADGLRTYGETVPFACLPTTAGTGSEVTRSSVITEDATHRKMTLKHEWLRPRLAILDPKLTVTVPPSVTAATGVDALVHAIEGFSCTKTQPISQAFGAQAIPLIFNALPTAYREPDNIEARSDMLLGSLLAGLCFGSADVAGVHCLAEALGGLYDTPHGIANAVFLLPVLRYNAETHPEVHAKIARYMGLATTETPTTDAVHRLFERLEEWIQSLDIPPLRALANVREADKDKIVALALENNSTASNVRPLGQPDYEAILASAFQ